MVTQAVLVSGPPCGGWGPTAAQRVARADPRASFYSLPSELKLRLLLSDPGRAGGAVFSCRELLVLWCSTMDDAASMLLARFPGQLDVALCRMYDMEMLQPLLPPLHAAAEAHTAVLLGVALRMQRRVRLTNPTAPPPPPPLIQAAEHAAAARLVVAAAVSTDVEDLDCGGVVRCALQRVPGCCSPTQLNAMLVMAAREGREGVVRALLGGGADGAAVWRDGYPHPVEVLLSRPVGIVEVLLSHGAMPLERYAQLELLRASSRRGLSGVTQLALQAPGLRLSYLEWNEALTIAAGSGHMAVVKALLEVRPDGADLQPDLEDPLQAALSSGHVEMARVLLKEGGSMARTIRNIGSDAHVPRVKTLKEMGVDAGLTGWRFVLRRAVCDRQHNLLAALLAMPGLPQLQKPALQTALQDATKFDNQQAADMLVAAGADAGDALRFLGDVCKDPLPGVQLLSQSGVDAAHPAWGCVLSRAVCKQDHELLAELLQVPGLVQKQTPALQFLLAVATQAGDQGAVRMLAAARAQAH